MLCVDGDTHLLGQYCGVPRPATVGPAVLFVTRRHEGKVRSHPAPRIVGFAVAEALAMSVARPASRARRWRTSEMDFFGHGRRMISMMYMAYFATMVYPPGCTGGRVGTNALRGNA